jgi:hypothetical protein
MGTDAAIDIATRVGGATTDIATRVTGAIRDAARATGAGFEYLLNTAIRESNLNPNAKARTSSATGLFQFIDQTWLGTMKQSGAAHGYGRYADAITRTPSGRFAVSDPAMRLEIMALRKEPAANAVMAGEFANANAKVLKDRLGRKPTDGELYMAHFLGASGAARFIRAAEANPNGKAAALFPRAAHANNSIFYDKTGAARSLKQVYAGLVTRHDVIGRASQIAAVKPTETVKPAVAVAAAKPAPVPVAPPLIQTASNSVLVPKMVKTIAITPTAPATPAAIAAVSETVTTTAVRPPSATASTAAIAPEAPAAFAEHAAPLSAPEAKAASKAPEAPLFLSLYQPEQRGPVAPVVRELWGARQAAAVETTDVVAAPMEISAQRKRGPSLNAPLDLFQFMRPSARRPA